MVYPGALHTRFQHAIGAMHLMGEAIETLRSKGFDISDLEAQGATLAILLHDIGHGPFSHALEHHIVSGISHEEITLMIDRKGRPLVPVPVRPGVDPGDPGHLLEQDRSTMSFTSPTFYATFWDAKSSQSALRRATTCIPRIGKTPPCSP